MSIENNLRTLQKSGVTRYIRRCKQISTSILKFEFELKAKMRTEENQLGASE